MARKHRVETRLNDRELGLLKEFADSLDIPMSEALRTLVQSLAIRRPPHHPSD
jgi:antitoxin component of RelBE/YafQ-DinJ toxin-antitoxin module